MPGTAPIVVLHIWAQYNLYMHKIYTLISGKHELPSSTYLYTHSFYVIDFIYNTFWKVKDFISWFVVTVGFRFWAFVVVCFSSLEFDLDERRTEPKLTSNLQQFSCLSFQSSGIIGIPHHAWLIPLFLKSRQMLCQLCSYFQKNKNVLGNLKHT